jgi:hypothetical protein
MHPLELEIQEIAEQYKAGQLTVEERNWLLGEIRDIRAAQECAGNEVMFRYVVEACNFAISVV